VKLAALKDKDGSEGIEVRSVIDFVHWLDSESSAVSEYSFSNSSLEEVFLRVTQEDMRDGEDEDRQQHFQDDDVRVDAGFSCDHLSRFKADLSWWNQAIAIWKFFLTRGWTGRGSIRTYIIYVALVAGSASTLLFDLYIIEWCPFLMLSMSIMLLFIIGPVYSDRSEGQFDLMKSHGLLPKGYVVGFSLYAFSIQLIHNMLTLTVVFASPRFRGGFNFERHSETWYMEHSYVHITWFSDEYKGESVNLAARRVSGGYGMIVGLAIVAALPTVGYALCTAFFPGHYLTVVAIMSGVFVGSVLESEIFESEIFEHSIEWDYYTRNGDGCVEEYYTLDSVDSQFVDCTGSRVRFASLIPSVGIREMLITVHSANIEFISDQEGYVQDILIPTLQGQVHCKDRTCSFPRARHLFGLHLLFTIIGSVLVILLGLRMAYILGFPSASHLRWRQAWKEAVLLRLHQGMTALKEACTCFRKSQFHAQIDDMEDTGLELAEVNEERQIVENVVQPLLNHGNMEVGELPEVTQERVVVENLIQILLTDDIVDGRSTLHRSEQRRDEFPPVLTHRLRKVYPALGHSPPKVALDSLDLHVPKGEVLGLLGRNGAGKTTALKILSGAHDSSGGIGLVAGYDCKHEKISVYERLGNCAQFDVVWRSQSVQRHLEFFAGLKGLPQSERKAIARAIADAVGLGSEDLYTRSAGSLSGGMRRRLSIGMALIGSPSVVILDEPTTGLDPATRSSIWSLIRSFASNDRSMIITTHMMNEADTLCDRIAIVVDGKLVVIGTQQYLKKKFSDGYVLHLSLVDSSCENQERAMRFVRKYLHESASLGVGQTKTMNVHLPRDTNLERMFQALYSEERTSEGGIHQFLLSQSSLEDVFVSLAD